jgi:RHS repeat-associated protein
MPGEWAPTLEQTLAGYGYPLYDMSHNMRHEVFGNTATNSFTYTAFGSELYNSSSAAQPYFRFQGEEGAFRDIANFLNQRERFVDTVKGRFASRDLIGFEGGEWDQYRIVGNRPDEFFDPLGLQIRSSSKVKKTFPTVDQAGLADVKVSCKGLNPSNDSASSCRNCENCAQSLAVSLPGAFSTALSYLALGPSTNIPTLRVGSCQIDCQVACQKSPPGSGVIGCMIPCMAGIPSTSDLAYSFLQYVLKVLAE